MNQQERHSRFIKWSDDLERRWANRLCGSNPKDEPRVELAINETTAQRLRHNDKPKLKVEVAESLTNAGAWEVIVNGRTVSYYSGPYAHERASKKASDVANDIA